MWSAQTADPRLSLAVVHAAEGKFQCWAMYVQDRAVELFVVKSEGGQMDFPSWTQAGEACTATNAVNVGSADQVGSIHHVLMSSCDMPFGVHWHSGTVHQALRAAGTYNVQGAAGAGGFCLEENTPGAANIALLQLKGSSTVTVHASAYSHIHSMVLAVGEESMHGGSGDRDMVCLLMKLAGMSRSHVSHVAVLPVTVESGDQMDAAILQCSAFADGDLSHAAQMLMHAMKTDSTGNMCPNATMLTEVSGASWSAAPSTSQGGWTLGPAVPASGPQAGLACIQDSTISMGSVDASGSHHAVG